MLFVFIYTFLCNRNHPKRKEEMEQQIPFSYVIISPENATEKEGYMISTIDKCGFFFCQKGEVEVALNDKSYLYDRQSLAHPAYQQGYKRDYAGGGFELYYSDR